MFVIFEHMRPVFRNYRRSPYFKILLIVIAVHVLLFVLTPPFHFKPYTLAAQDTLFVQEVPDDIAPPEPEEEPPLPFDPDPMTDEHAPEIEPPVTSPADFRELLKIPVVKNKKSTVGYIHWDKAPVPLKLERPSYPLLARQAGIEGIVHVLVTIGVDGKVNKARVLSSNVTDAMNREAVKAARKCTFRPAEQQGKAVQVAVVIPFEFRLHKAR